MKLCRFGDNRLGLVTGDQVRDVTAALDVLPTARYPYPQHDVLIANLPKLAARVGEIAGSAPVLTLKDCKLLTPVANAGKVVAAPVNYKKHLEEARSDPELHHQNQIAEIQRVGLFLKATSSVIGAGEEIVIRHPDRRTDHEIELAAVIGKTADKVTREQALDHIAGYCLGLDITVRGPEERSLRKSIDTYTVLGPWFITADEVGNASELDLELTVNGEPRQKANTRDLVIGIADLIVFASSFYTLHPGDVILTGTPEGVGPIKPGDTIDARITKVGAMQVKVRGA
ncbi:MAG: fumarylacetoacetate hydrolase family protein [Xanthobacteraceae bacterium]|uniref:fumarylacetoacetate hydrolase family protein n=1 Tax=Pseudolabrys sp. TaxID=1960880 RepID=UPI003D0E43B9